MNVSEKWKRFKLAWDSYSLPTELHKKSEAVQVATLLTIIGEDARDVFSTFTWESAEEATKIKPVLEQFADYCALRKNVPFERYRFNKRTQEASESYDQYRTALLKLAEGCEFSTITPEEILRDHLVFGISDHKVCRSGKRRTGAQKDVKTVEELAKLDESDREIYVIAEISTVTLDNSQLVTVKLESGNCLLFQPDTGPQCNVIPLELYKKATNDPELKGVRQAKTAIVAYGGSRLPVVGQVIIPVWREGQRFKLDCQLVDNIDIRPILGRKACLGMNISQYMDNNEIHKPEVGNAPVYTMTSASSLGLNRADLIRQFPRVFAEEVGQLEGEYHIKLHATIPSVQHAPRRVPVALRDQLKAELDKMTEQGIISPVTAPTPWVSSLVVVPKKNGMLRLCLDPKDLNKAIQREHYPLPTIEDVATRLHGAKVFTKLDVRSSFWHITLDNASSYLTTFNTPFGRFRWRRMPFRIRSALRSFSAECTN